MAKKKKANKKTVKKREENGSAPKGTCLTGCMS